MNSERLMSRRRARGLALPTAFLAVAAILVACGTETTGSDEATGDATTPPAAEETTAPVEEVTVDVSGIPGIDMVPEAAQQNYMGSDTFVKLQANPYEGWTPTEGPWKFCMSESYTGNNWRQLHIRELQREVDLMVQQGVATDALQIVDANSNTALQLSQFQQLVDDGCDVIMVLPNSPEALCDNFAQANEAGVLVITSSAPVDCPKAMNVGHSGYHKMYVTAKSVVEALGGEGTILSVTGVLGVTAEEANQQAINKILEEYPGIEVVGEVEGKWTGSVAQAETAKFLATHPGQIDGVFEMGEMDVAVARAFQQAGREIPVIGAASGEAAAYALWKENPDKFVGAICQTPEGAAYEIIHVALRMLAGQQPALNTLIFPLPRVTEANFDDYYDESYTTSTQGYPIVPGGAPTPDTYWDDFFTGGEPVDSAFLLPTAG